MTGTLTPGRSTDDRNGEPVLRARRARPSPGPTPGSPWPRRLLVAAAVLVVVAGAAAAVMLAPATAVEHVDVRVAGVAEPSLEQAVRSAAEVNPGDPWLLVRPDAVRARVAALGDVASVRVRREWPDRVSIDVAPARTVLLLEVTEGDPSRRAPGAAAAVTLEIGPGGRVRRSAPADTDPAGAVPDPSGPAGVPTLRVDPALLPTGPPPPGALLPDPVRVAAVLFEQIPSSLRPLLTDAQLNGPDRNGPDRNGPDRNGPDRNGAVDLEFRLPEILRRATVRFGPLEQLTSKIAAAEAMLGGRVDLECLETLDVRRPDRPTLVRSCPSTG